MKLSFSIQNWKGIRWNEFLRAAVSTRMSGIELYDIAGPVFAGKESPANPELAPSIRRRLISDGLSVSCINTVADFTDPSFMREMEECIRIAVNLGIPYIGIHTSSSDAMDGIPPTCVAMQGIPNNMASPSELGEFSINDGITNTSEERYSSFICPASSCPINRTRSSRA